MFKTIEDLEEEELPESTITKRLWLIFKGKGVRCGDCLTVLKNQDLLAKHTAAYHQDEEQDPDAATYLSPYRFIKDQGKFICPLGCKNTFVSGKVVRKHLVNEHQDKDLSPWGYSRDLLYKEYLLLLEKADLEEEGGETGSLVGQKRLRHQALIKECNDDDEDAFQK